MSEEMNIEAAYGLSDSARATLVETVGSALKTLVMSAAYLAEHDAFIKSELQRWPEVVRAAGIKSE